MKVTALIENKTTGDLKGEHGLSVHIEHKGKSYLLDTGASNEFLENAHKLGIDLRTIDIATLSHAHYDHFGGFEGFFSKNSTAKVYLQHAAKAIYYAKLGFLKKNISMPQSLLDTYSDRFVFVDGDYEIDKDVWVISHKTPGLDARGKKAHMYRQTGTGLVPDDFQHEQSLVFNLENGLVILNSCCHGGADTIIEEVMNTFNGKKVLAIIGGFHLMGITGTNSISGKPQTVRALAKRLAGLNVAHIYTCHCTGDPGYKLLKETLGERLQYFSTGTTIEL